MREKRNTEIHREAQRVTEKKQKLFFLCVSLCLLRVLCVPAFLFNFGSQTGSVEDANGLAGDFDELFLFQFTQGALDDIGDSA